MPLAEVVYPIFAYNLWDSHRVVLVDLGLQENIGHLA